MRIRRTSGGRERVSTSGQGIVPRRPTHNPSLSPSSSFRLSSPHPLMLPPYLSFETFHLFYLGFVSLCLPSHSNTHIHTSTFSLPLSLYSLPPQSAVTAATFSRPLIYYRSPSQKGPFKKGQRVPSEHTHTHTHTQPHTVHGFANAVHKLHGNLELICTKHFAYLQIRTAHTLSLTLSHTHTQVNTQQKPC